MDVPQFPLQGLYRRLVVYGMKPTTRIAQPWLQRIESLKPEIFESLLEAIPEWIAGEERHLARLLWELRERRPLSPGIIEEAFVHIQARRGHWPVVAQEAVDRIPPTEERLVG